MSRPPAAAAGIEVLVISTVTVLLLAASWFKWLPLDFTEALGFATVAVCVWLVTKGEHLSKQLPLTALLYGGFLALFVTGSTSGTKCTSGSKQLLPGSTFPGCVFAAPQRNC